MFSLAVVNLSLEDPTPGGMHAAVDVWKGMAEHVVVLGPDAIATVAEDATVQHFPTWDPVPPGTAIDLGLGASDIHDIPASTTIAYADSRCFGPFTDVTEAVTRRHEAGADVVSLSAIPAHLVGATVRAPGLSTEFLSVVGSLAHSVAFRRMVRADPWLFNLPTWLESHGITHRALLDPVFPPAPRADFNGDPLAEMPGAFLRAGAAFLATRALTIDPFEALDRSSQNETAAAVDLVRAASPRWADAIESWLVARYPVDRVRDVLGTTFIVTPAATAPDIRAAVFAHLYYEDQFPQNADVLAALPASIDLHLSVRDHAAVTAVEREFRSRGRVVASVSIAPPRGRDVAALLLTFADSIRDYEVVCFIHDKKTSGGLGRPQIGDSFRRLLWDSLLGDEGHVCGILALFVERTRLGLLVPPLPIHSEYGQLLGRGWTSNFDVARELATDIGLVGTFTEAERPLAMGTCFWCRPDALAPLFDARLALESFPPEPMGTDGTVNHAVERLLPFVAHDRGYLVGSVQDARTAADRLTTYEAMLARLVARQVDRYGTTQVSDMLSDEAGERRTGLLRFARGAQTLAIYGQGRSATNVAAFLDRHNVSWDLSIVSNDYTPTPLFLGRPGVALRELAARRDGISVVVAVARVHRDEVATNLAQSGVTEVYLA